MLKRFFYFVYYFRETNWAKLMIFLDVATKSTHRSKFSLLLEAILDTFKFNVSILDYFYFRFYEKPPDAKKEYAGTGFMYEYQLRMNPVSSRDVLNNKIKFLNIYKQFVRRRFASKDSLVKQPNLLHRLANDSGKIVVKGSKGQIGAEVRILNLKDFTDSTRLVTYMNANNFDLVEEFVVQHSALMRLSPSGLNTVRVITQLKNNTVVVLAARLRITVNSDVDNMAAGNLAAPIDLITGIVSGKAVYSDISRSSVTTHPVTAIAIPGFEIPHWDKIIMMVKTAALVMPQNQSVGWDVAVTATGPELIEGNHNWCKLLWQLPVDQGLKNELEQFIN